MERPPQTVIDYFYKLSDFNPQKRIAAARELLQNEARLVKSSKFCSHSCLGHD